MIWALDVLIAIAVTASKSFPQTEQEVCISY